MHDFMKNVMEWLLEKEEKSVDKCAVPLKDIDKQIALVTTKKEKYQKECEDMLHEFDHILVRLNAIREKSRSCSE